LEFQGSCPQDYQVSVGLKDLSFPASTRENQSSLGMSFSSILTSKSSEPGYVIQHASGSEYGTAG